ncbi:hypothetical protein L9F63_005954 [Diploptera punctata]|uniref:Uncharacterized protein n=1 Tax=Diploptera punctata TaxID=6984 RepID=A0AAD8E4Y3_DIPPU|nr:hypothetical protein L9F63_005954 [Diploptera punctata]
MFTECLTVVLLGSVCFAAPPSYIKPCALNDPKYDDCVLQHAKDALGFIVKGDRKLKIPNFDPLEILELKPEDVPHDSLAFTLKDIKLLGFRDIQLEKLVFDFKDNHANMVFDMPTLILLGKYDVTGRLLILPITGNGDVNSTTVHPRITYNADIKYVERNGNTHIQLENPTVDMNPEHVYTNLTNLFNGNELLGKEMNDFMNKNWKEVNDELSPPVRQAIGQVVTSSINNLFMTATRDELFPKTL